VINFIAHAIDLVLGVGLGFFLTIASKSVVEPLAASLGRKSYSYVKDKYLQQTLDKLDGQLAEAFNFVDDAILPEELEDSKLREDLKQAVLSEFSLGVWLDKAEGLLTKK
jgi:hypothetical protein